MNRDLLLPSQNICNLCQRWLCQAGVSVDDPVLFVKWLTHHDLIIDYQADVLLRPRNDPLVL